MKEKALAWLRKQMAQKLRSLHNAEKRPNVTQEELDNLREHIELINYTIMKLEDGDDTAPVVHGHWIYHVDDLFPTDSTQECSVCHEEEYMTLRHENYCPNCGTKMDGENNVPRQGY